MPEETRRDPKRPDIRHLFQIHPERVFTGVHTALAGSCFNILKGLRFNIAHLTSSFLDDDKDKGLQDRVSANIGPALRYACRWWAHHLSVARPGHALADSLRTFLHTRCLFWIEVMNLIEMRGQCSRTLGQARKWLNKLPGSQSMHIDEFTDAESFAAFFEGNPMSQSTPHLYLSALASWTRQSKIVELWKKDFAWLPKIIHKKAEMSPVTMIKASGVVEAMAFSNDGQWIATMEYTGVTLWDVSTGRHRQVYPFRGDSASLIAFSRNDERLAVGGLQGRIIVWDILTSKELGSYNSHTSRVSSITFSTDNRWLASGSQDGTVCICDLLAGKESAASWFTGNPTPVIAVSFLEGGHQVVSVLWDNSVRVCDITTGKSSMVYMEPHLVYCSAISNDAQRMLLGLGDYSIRLRAVSTGDELQTFTGHTEYPFAVAFLCDDQELASVAVDRSVKIWDVSTGAMLRAYTVPRPNPRWNEGSVVAFSQYAWWMA